MLIVLKRSWKKKKKIQSFFKDLIDHFLKFQTPNISAELKKFYSLTRNIYTASLEIFLICDSNFTKQTFKIL